MKETYTGERLENEIEARGKRIADLEAQVLQLSHDRDRLCKCILENPARKALVELVDRIDGVHPEWAYMSLSDVINAVEMEAARKALADTEHETWTRT